jgi:hypothetical protein
MKYEYIWQILLANDEVIERSEDFQEVGEAGELSLYNKRWVFWPFKSQHTGGITFAAEEWVSIDAVIRDNTDDEV